jgi:outer membrane protein OmpA-like peptidoglycan-associated protein
MCVRTDDSPPEARARGVRLLACALVLLMLAACASKPKKVAPPVIEPGPVTRPVTAPPAQRPAPPKPPVVTPPPPARNFAQEKARRKLELAADEGNSVGASEVGYYLDVLLGRLKQRLGSDTGVARHGQHIVVVLPASAGFPVGGSALTPALRSKLTPLAQVLVEYRRVLVSVYVRADASVIGASNPRLAEQRTKVVAAYLGGAGLDPRRVLGAPPAPPRPGVASPGGGSGRIEIQLEPVLRPRARR